jgi:hypothetical protein
VHHPTYALSSPRRTLNKSLLTDQQKWRDSVKSAEESKAKHEVECQTKVADMEAQVRDLMFHFETQQKVEGSSHKAELQVGGSVESVSLPADVSVLNRRG